MVNKAATMSLNPKLLQELHKDKWCNYRHRGPKHKHAFVCQYVVPPAECYYNTLLFFTVKCGIMRFLCPMHVFKVQTSSSSPRLTLWKIAWPPLLS